MYPDNKLAFFFQSKRRFVSMKLSFEIYQILKVFLKNSDVHKQQRMIHLLSERALYQEPEWLEWFNWYYFVFDEVQFPLWLQQELEAFAADSKNISLISYPELLAAGWAIKDVVVSSIRLSAAGINDYEPDEHELAHWVRLRQKNLSLFSGAILAGELVGQIGFIMLGEDEYHKLRVGTLVENQIVGVDENYDGKVYLYIPSVVIKKTLQNRSLLLKLLRHLFSQLQQSKIAHRVDGFIALAYSSAGESLCQKLNFQLNTQNQGSYKAYTGSLSDVQQSFFAEKLGFLLKM